MLHVAALMVSGLVLFFTSWQLASTGASQPATNANGAVDYSVTMAARVCPTYTDVFANRARNNIMESLQDLGPDSPYTNFVAVDPSVEDGMAPQTSCKPLPNWTFAFGNGIGANANGTNLSYVTGTASVNNRQVTTQASTPLLDTNGNPTGQQIAGATTFTLTSAELNLAGQGNFWVMGGTPSQPLNGLGEQYGFAALRCAMDNVNGDNVEWIGFPSGMSHVFCYAFYVQPPPTAGTIVIKKSLNQALPAAQTFDFAGSLSYNPGGAFSVTVPANATSAEETFIRGETGTNAPWTAAETIPDGFQLVGLTCASQSGAEHRHLLGQRSEFHRSWRQRSGQHLAGGGRHGDVHVHQRSGATSDGNGRDQQGGLDRRWSSHAVRGPAAGLQLHGHEPDGHRLHGELDRPARQSERGHRDHPRSGRRPVDDHREPAGTGSGLAVGLGGDDLRDDRGRDAGCHGDHGDRHGPLGWRCVVHLHQPVAGDRRARGAVHDARGDGHVRCPVRFGVRRGVEPVGHHDDGRRPRPWQPVRAPTHCSGPGWCSPSRPTPHRAAIGSWRLPRRAMPARR